jgi:hypothetical protein
MATSFWAVGWEGFFAGLFLVFFIGGLLGAGRDSWTALLFFEVGGKSVETDGDGLEKGSRPNTGFVIG